jgi:UDP-glucose 4-epimerase
VSRVLVTGGVGAIGAAVVRRLLGDPDWEVRVSDQREAPGWMREGAAVHAGDLRDPDEAQRAVSGCTHVVHLAEAPSAGPFTLADAQHAVLASILRAAADEGIERFVYVSSGEVFEHATEFPTTEEHLASCPPPTSAYKWSKLAGERLCHFAHEEFELPFTICRIFDSAEITNIADGIVTAMAHPNALNEDFNIAAPDPQSRRGPSVEKAARLLRWRAES